MDNWELGPSRVLRLKWDGVGARYQPGHLDGLFLSALRRAPETSDEKADDETELDEDAARLYRGAAARANYLAMDRPELALASKELCRTMSAPRRGDLAALRRLARYLLGSPRVVLW